MPVDRNAFSVRPFVPEDVAGCLAVWTSNEPTYFLPSERPEFEAFLDRLPGPYLVITNAGGEIVAAGGWAPSREDARVATLCWGMVRRELHKQGLGRWLLQARLEDIAAHPAFVGVQMNTSQHSVGFFLREGFRVVTMTPNGFGGGLDRYDLEWAAPLPLPPSPPAGR